MKQKLKLTTEEIRNRAIEIILNLPLDVVHSVEVKEWKKDRSSEQNALYRVWIRAIGNEVGYSENEQDLIYKEMFLAGIFEHHRPEFAEIMTTLRKAYKESESMGARALKIRKFIVNSIHTSDANVQEMQEYLTSISRHAASLGIRLPYFEG